MTLLVLSCFCDSSLDLMFPYFYVFTSRNQSNLETHKTGISEIPVVQEPSVSPHHPQFYSFSWSRNNWAQHLLTWTSWQGDQSKVELDNLRGLFQHKGFCEISPRSHLLLVTSWKSTRLECSIFFSALEMLGCDQVRSCFHMGGIQTLPLVAKGGFKNWCLSQMTARSSLCSEELSVWESNVSSQALRNNTLQKTLGFHTIRIGVLLHETEKWNKIWGIVLVFCSVLFNLKEKKLRH